MDLQDRRILVTGGAGFVGSNLVKRLIRAGARVTVLDDLFTGRRENLPDDGYEFVEGSVWDGIRRRARATRRPPARR